MLIQRLSRIAPGGVVEVNGREYVFRPEDPSESGSPLVADVTDPADAELLLSLDGGSAYVPWGGQEPSGDVVGDDRSGDDSVPWDDDDEPTLAEILDAIESKDELKRFAADAFPDLSLDGRKSMESLKAEVLAAEESE